MSTSLPTAVAAEAARVQRIALIVGGVALVVCIVGAFFSPPQFFRAYLTAYLFYLGIALGSFVIVMIHHLTGGAWGYVVRRTLEAGMRTLPLLAVLFIPIACGLGYLYIWARPEAVAEYADLQHKRVYLNDWFFWGRAILYFALWIGIAFVLDFWSHRFDQTGDPRILRRQSHLSGPGLIVYGISMTFAAVDWIMSLDPKFHSTIFGPLVATGQILSAQAIALLVLAWLGSRPPLAAVLSPEVLNDLGNLLFTYLIMWAYMVWFQFMLIWIANLPFEVLWYRPRTEGGWLWVAWALTVLHFVIPFFLLLMRDIKQHLPTLAAVAGLLLFMQLVHNYYLVMPSFPDTTIAEHWMDFLMPLGLGSIWLAYFLWQLQRYPLLPRRDEDLAEAMHLRRVDQEEAAREEKMQHG